MDFSNPDYDIDHYFYEIDLSREEKLALLDILDTAEPIGGSSSLAAWDTIYNIDGTIYRVYGALGNYTFDENSLITRLEPYDTHSGR
jgi:hypothetical protein